jgi:PTS system mannitol-specific IIC component
MLLLKLFGKDDDDLEAAQARTLANKAESKGASVGDTKVAWSTVTASSVKKIIFACDAGMGSSAMGATKLRKKIKGAGLDIDVTHSPVGEVPRDADIIVCHRDLAQRAKDACPSAKLITITDFLNAPEYDQLVDELKK